MIRPRRATPRRRTAPRWTTDQWAAGNVILNLRCRGRCERCGADLNRTGVERAHRQRRTVGGDRLANIAMLCPPCHAWSHSHPGDAMVEGWIVSSFGTDPADVPVIDTGGRSWTLDDMGAKSPA